MIKFSIRIFGLCAAFSVLLFTGNELAAQSITLKKSFPLTSESVVTIADMDKNGQPEIVVQSPSAIRFKNGKTMASEWLVLLDSTKGESLFSEEVIAPRIRDLSLWKDYNGNGVNDVLVGGGDETGGYIRFVDPSTNTTLLKTGYIPTVYSLSVADIDADGFYDIVISRDDSLLVYSTLAKVATGGNTDVDERFGSLSQEKELSIVPNPTNSSTQIACLNGYIEEATVYDAKGARVAVIQPNAKGSVLWKGTDDSGNTVTAGTYYVLAKKVGGASLIGTVIKQ